MPPSERDRFIEELQRHFDALYSYAWWMTRGSDEAEDIVHDAVSRAISRWAQYSPGTSMKAWLFTILRRTYFNRLRRARIEVTSAKYPGEDRLPVQPGDRNPGRLPAFLLRRDIDAALAALAEEQRSLILLADVEELSLREIAELEEIPLGTVKSRLWRARNELRRILIDYEGSPE